MYAVYYNNKGKLTGPYMNIISNYRNSIILDETERTVREIAKKKPLIYKVKVTPIIK